MTPLLLRAISCWADISFIWREQHFAGMVQTNSMSGQITLHMSLLSKLNHTSKGHLYLFRWQQHVIMYVISNY